MLLDFAGNEASLGKNHTSADIISLTSFLGVEPEYRIDISWFDGGHVWAIYDDKNEAIDHANRLGFYPCKKVFS